MRRSIALVMCVALLAGIALGPLPASAINQSPLNVGEGGAPGALEGYYRTGNGHFQWLMLGAPRACLDGSGHEPTGANDCELVATVWFYTAACNRVGIKRVPLTTNDVAVLPLHSTSVTTNPVGNVLVGGTLPNGPFTQVTPASGAVIGEMFYVDVNRGIARLQHMATIPSGDFGDGTTGNPAWTSFRPAHAWLFAPPDDGVNFFNTLIVRCPTGVSVTSAGSIFGTEATLGGDMLNIAAISGEGADPGAAYAAASATAAGVSADTLCLHCFGASSSTFTFAQAITATVFNTDEELLGIIDNIPCRCLGVDPGTGFVEEVRLSALLPAAASSETYWELFSTGGPDGEEIFAAAKNIQVIADGLNLNFYSDLHNTNGGVAETFNELDASP